MIPKRRSSTTPTRRFLPPGATFDDDPLLKRARALRDTAAQITADLGGAPVEVVVVEAPPPYEDTDRGGGARRARRRPCWRTTTPNLEADPRTSSTGSW